MAKPRLYIEPGAEVDCAYTNGSRAPVRGFLRLPDRSSAGRLRFIQDIRQARALVSDAAVALPLVLYGRATPTPACVIDCFVASHRFSIPFPPPYPLEVVANAVIVGSDDADRGYAQATLRSERLLDFLDAAELTPARVASGETYAERARVDGEGWSLMVAETATMKSGDTSASLRWYGELTACGDDRPLSDWVETLADFLLLFAFLSDKPLAPERVYAGDESRPIDYYASWPEPHAPSRTEPLVTLRRVDGRLAEIVFGWRRLRERAPDLVAHVAEYQVHRDRNTLPGRALGLFRCLELYHDYGKRFASTIRPKEAHRRLVSELLAALPDDLRADHGTWISAALREANRKRLVGQVEEILADLGPSVMEWCFIADAAEFATVAKSTRNHYTHPTGKPPAHVPKDGLELYILVQRLWFVVRACVLFELGFSRDEIASALKRSSQRHYRLK